MTDKYLWMCGNCATCHPASFDIEWDLICPACKGPLSLRIDKIEHWRDATTDLPGVWRYLPLLPTSRKWAELFSAVGQSEFKTPIDVPELARILGVKSVSLLGCTSGPSGTFKDIEAAIVIAKCLDWGFADKKLSWHSTGNTARAYRAYALRAGLQSFSFFPLSCLTKWDDEARNPGGVLVAYDGPFQELSAVAKDFAANNELTHLAPLRWKLEGKAGLAYAIAEHRPSTTCIVQTIAGGYGPLGTYLGLRRLREWGLTEQIPRFEMFQIEGADTISKLLPLNRDIEVTDLRLPFNPFEPTLQSTNPLATFNLVRRMSIENNSTVTSVSVSDVELHADVFTQACERHGVAISYTAEKSPYISWAGLVARSKSGALRATEEVMLVVTGAAPRPNRTPDPDIVLSRQVRVETV